MKNILKNKANLIILRWTILLTGMLTIYYLVNKNIPTEKDIMMLNLFSSTSQDYVLLCTLPFNIRVLDILAPLVLCIHAISFHYCLQKTEIQNDYVGIDYDARYILGTILIIGSIVFFTVGLINFGLISGLIFSLMFILVIILILILGISLILLKKIFKILLNWLSGN